jgi:ATP-dependent helicase/nuclease subunit A
MTPRDAASARQVEAADPAASTWLSANAGSGKTRVLTDRVARLLLGGVAPERILCLTYTKAAAGEMQNRLFARLGAWSMLDEARLRDELAALGVEDSPDTETLARARRLFARAIETPGGLKIQTIHSFCAGLLRRFPLEAGVSPNFTEMDERTTRQLREEVLEELAETDPEAVSALARHVGGEDLDRLLAEIVSHGPALSRDLEWEEALKLFGLPAGFTDKDLPGMPFDGSEAALIRALVPVLEQQSKTMQDLAATLATIDPMAPTRAELDMLYGAFLLDSGRRPEAKTRSVPTSKAGKAMGDALLGALHGFMQRVADTRAAELALAAAGKTFALHRFAAGFLPAIETRKARQGWLDFDDLIRRAVGLLTEPSVAQWVLFKLDGGVDHILVDEAQDTSPDQWQVIECLTQELTAGVGAQDAGRTIFVVGDKKQSIYSFQGADLRAFDAMRAQFSQRLAQVDVGLGHLTLEHSFRSSEAILRLVDIAFDERRASGLGGEVRHIAFHGDLPGRVDLWPAVTPSAKPPEGDWWDPVDIIQEEHHTARLARQIAREVERLIRGGAAIPDGRDGGRPVRAGDVLILVRRRSALFHQIIAACKTLRLPIAGADRMNLGAELAVKDLAALMSFLATPEDDLSLAALLRSPLLGWSEADLYDLAQGRGRAYLWEVLRNRTDAPETLAILGDMRLHADFLRPYDLLERMLTHHDGRRRLLARLGPEAEDGIDAFLSQALGYERTEVPSLTGFLGWMDAEDVQVKRQLDSAGDRIRVMTVHGAKGLESPIVILPDTARRKPPPDPALCPLPDGRVAWRTAGAEAPPALAAALEDARRARDEEDARLLYVAMTRAETWLIVAAAGEVGDGTCWYDRVAEGLEHAGAVAQGFPSGEGLRLQHGDWPQPAGEARPAPSVHRPVPPWASEAAPPAPEPAQPLLPSDLGGAKALPGEAVRLDEEAALRRGRQLHRLLEHLPLWPESDWPVTARDLLASGEDPARPAEAEGLLEEARGVLTAPDLAFLFSKDALTEVEITAELAGQRMIGAIDRLFIADDRVLAVDFKSNVVVPDRPEDVPLGLLRQMAAYEQALWQIWPDRHIEVALIWTRTARLMTLPPALLHSSLASAVLDPRAGGS